MRTATLWTLTVLTLVFGLYGLASWGAWMNATASACGNTACVWVYDPFVAPGGSVTLTVGVYDGLKAGVEQVRVRGPGVDVSAAGAGATWGGSFSTETFQRGHDAVDVAVEIPAQASGTLPLEVELTWVAATYAGFTGDNFENVTRTDTVVVPTTVRSPAQVALRRIGAALGAFGALIVGTGVVGLGLRELRAVEDSGDSNLTQAAAAASLILAMGWAVVGWYVLARPLQAALDLPSTALSVIAVLGWVGGTGAGGWRLQRVEWRAPYHLRLPAPLAPAQVERWLRRLRDEGVEVRRLPGVVELRRGADRVWVVRPGWGSDVSIRGEGDDLVLLMAVSAARTVGALELEVPGIVLPVAADATFAAVREALDGRMRDQLVELQEVMRRAGELLDRMRPLVR